MDGGEMSEERSVMIDNSELLQHSAYRESSYRPKGAASHMVWLYRSPISEEGEKEKQLVGTS